MSDFLSEDRLSLNELARLSGVNPSTVWRWVMRGVKGVKLETFTEGGRRYTSRQAHGRFVEGCTNVANGTSPNVRTPAKRERDIRRAEAELAEMGV